MSNCVCSLNLLFPGEHVTYAFKLKYSPKTSLQNKPFINGKGSKYWNATQMHNPIGFCFEGSKPEPHQVNKAAEKALQTVSLEGESS